MELSEKIANCGYCDGKGCGVCNVWRIELLKAENERLRGFAKRVHKGPHHTAIDATKCGELVDWVCDVMDNATALLTGE